jgi:hypothetical protein
MDTLIVIGYFAGGAAGGCLCFLLGWLARGASVRWETEHPVIETEDQEADIEHYKDIGI